MADNKLQSLSEIFNQKFFRIPDFQRGYSWGKKELEDFWEDLMNLSQDRVHYTGLLTIESIRKKEVQNDKKWKSDLWLINKGMKPYYLIDGQQRITTMIIFVKVILDKFNENEFLNYDSKENWVSKFLFQSYKDIKSYVFGYEKDNPSDEFFRTKILDQISISAPLYSETLYTYNLEQAKKYLELKIKNLKPEELQDIFVKLVNLFKFNLYEIDDEIDVYVTFETMNNRGKELSKLELLKNRLIYLTTLIEEDDNHKLKLRKDINDSWRIVYEYLGKNRRNPLNDDEFLKNHWIMFFKFEKSESEAFAKFLMQEHFTARNVLDKSICYKDISQYVESISKSVIFWYKMFNPNNGNFVDEITDYLNKLLRLGHASFSPIILTAFYKTVKNEKLVELLTSIEKFIFTVFYLNMRPSNTKSNYFLSLASEFYKGNKSVDNIIEDINYLLVTEQNYLGWYSFDDLVRKMNDLFERDNGFFSWKGLKYFLYEYELELQNKARGVLKVKWENINQESIEHILPQNQIKSCWKNSLYGYKAKHKRFILNSLGNLLLLSRSKNSEWSNECFDFKKKHQDKKGNMVGYFNGSYSEIEVSEFKTWTPKEILKRGLKMLNFIESKWKINVGSISEKKSLLRAGI